MSISKETIHNKLARDKIPFLLSEKNIQFIAKTLDNANYKTALSQKLQEEVIEYLSAKEDAHKLEELADILEVIHALLAEQGISFEELEIIRKKKLEERGGFTNRIFLEKTFKEHEDTDDHPKCIFCQIGKQKMEAEIVAKYEHCYVIKDQYPVSKGHLLIIPYEHTENWFTASEEIQFDILNALRQMKIYLDNKNQPFGYNIGANCGETAGQTVMHLHVHLIPRYKGDMSDPKGGVRGVIPDKQKY